MRAGYTFLAIEITNFFNGWLPREVVAFSCQINEFISNKQLIIGKYELNMN